MDDSSRYLEKRTSVERVLRETSACFAGEADVHATLKRLARDLESEAIPYAILGGMALNLWGYRRVTVDVNILLTRTGLAAFREKLVGRGYVLAFAGAQKTFREAQTQVKIEARLSGDYPGDGKPKPVAFPDPTEVSVGRDGYRVVTIEKLIELKLASGLPAPHRLKDLADVQELIATLDLPRELAEQLDASVRAEYLRLWQAVQNAPRDER